MAPTSKPTRLPVNLVTGLLGSGKTTVIQTLLETKPDDETWGILVNDFGEVGLDAALFEAQAGNDSLIEEVAGGCICCSAFIGYQQALGKLLKQPLDRLIIEPTGLGHPAKILDLLKQPPFDQQLQIATIFCITTATQLTPVRWQKSALMRDLITLADIVILNQTDLSTPQERTTAHELLKEVYPPKECILETHPQNRKSQLTLSDTPSLVDFKQNRPAFTLLSGLPEHEPSLNSSSKKFASRLPGCLTAKVRLGQTSSLGWVFSPEIRFNRTLLKKWVETHQSQLLRIKGVIQTGNEWQLINWADGHLSWQDIAWRQDSRLEIIFDYDISDEWPQIESELAPSLTLKSNAK